jgi:hypothetical protein
LHFQLVQNIYEGSLKNPIPAGDPACHLIDTIYRLLVYHLPDAVSNPQLAVFPYKVRHIFSGCLCVCGCVRREFVGISIYIRPESNHAQANLPRPIYCSGKFDGNSLYNLGTDPEVSNGYI